MRIVDNSHSIGRVFLFGRRRVALEDGQQRAARGGRVRRACRHGSARGATYNAPPALPAARRRRHAEDCAHQPDEQHRVSLPRRHRRGAVARRRVSGARPPRPLSGAPHRRRAPGNGNNGRQKPGAGGGRARGEPWLATRPTPPPPSDTLPTEAGTSSPSVGDVNATRNEVTEGTRQTRTRPIGVRWYHCPRSFPTAPIGR